MRVVLGLGNPGSKYRAHRHNVGFMVVDVMAERHGGEFGARGDLGDLAWTTELRLGDAAVLLAKPRTFMNRVGRAAAALRRRHDVDPGDLIVVYDDADLEFGRVRVRPEGGAGGHNGIRSLLDVLGTPAFPRVKLGVRGARRDASDLADYVLADFDPDERPGLPDMISRGADAVEAIVAEGVEAAMRRFNAPPGAPPPR